MPHQRWSTIKRQLGVPDFGFDWIAGASDRREVRLYCYGSPSLGREDVAELADGASHAHDEDVLEAMVRSFAARHGLIVARFVVDEDAAVAVTLAPLGGSPGSAGR